MHFIIIFVVIKEWEKKQLLKYRPILGRLFEDEDEDDWEAYNKAVPYSKMVDK